MALRITADDADENSGRYQSENGRCQTHPQSSETINTSSVRKRRSPLARYLSTRHAKTLSASFAQKSRTRIATFQIRQVSRDSHRNVSRHAFSALGHVRQVGQSCPYAFEITAAQSFCDEHLFQTTRRRRPHAAPSTLLAGVRRRASPARGRIFRPYHYPLGSSPTLPSASCRETSSPTRLCASKITASGVRMALGAGRVLMRTIAEVAANHAQRAPLLNRPAWSREHIVGHR